MNFKVTREVIIDLWPLYCAKEASTDSQELVESFLNTDPEFKSDLERSKHMTAMPPVDLSPNAELQMLANAREKARMKYTAIIIAIVAVSLISLGLVLALTKYILFH